MSGRFARATTGPHLHGRHRSLVGRDDLNVPLLQYRSELRGPGHSAFNTRLGRTSPSATEVAVCIDEVSGGPVDGQGREGVWRRFQ